MASYGPSIAVSWTLCLSCCRLQHGLAAGLGYGDFCRRRATINRGSGTWTWGLGDEGIDHRDAEKRVYVQTAVWTHIKPGKNQTDPFQQLWLSPRVETSRSHLMPLVLPDFPSPLQRNKQPAKQMSGTSAASHRPIKPSVPLPPHAPRRLAPSLKTPVASLLLLLLAAAAAVCLYSQSAARSHESRREVPPLSSPTVETIDDARAIWELPTVAPARGVLFVAHGCRCRPENFWPPSPRCPGCAGLPEDVVITQHALRRRFAVLAVASAGECWSLGKEVNVAKRVIRFWATKNGLEGLPVVALGASSGGYFVSRLAAKMSLAAVVIMIAEGAFRGSAGALPAAYPPAMFIHMPKDKRRAALVEKNSKMLMKNGIEVKELQSLELPLASNLLSERIPGLDRGLSERIWIAFREEGFVDEKGYMKEDGRATPWKDALVRRGFWEEVSPLADHIQEELNLAYGYHEMTSLHTEEMFDWVEKHLR